jgi:urease accessory protein
VFGCGDGNVVGRSLIGMGRAYPGSGDAQLRVASVHGLSAVVSSWAKSPLRLLTPRTRGETVLAYTSSFGGGMVAGDRTRLELTIDRGARCFLSTQASTKIYRNPAQLPCSHELIASIADDALLVLAPDPVQCFAESRYEQRQHFQLSLTASLIVVDWMSAGRTARGERWSFQRYFSRNEIERGGRTLLVDPLLLDQEDGALDSRFRGGRFNCFATIVVLGKSVEPNAKEILDWASSQRIEPGASLMFAASPLHEGVLLRLAGTSVEEVSRAIQERLGFVRELLDGNPWERKW